MKRLALCLTSSLMLLGSGAAHADVIRYTTTLSGAIEATPNDSPATGTARVLIDDVAGTMTVNASFAGLTAPTTASHIHCCTALPFEGAAGVATSLPTFPAFPLGVTSGSYTETFDLLNMATYNPAFVTNNGGTVAGAQSAFLAGLAAGRAYLNIHTVAFPGGEIRGFLVEAPADVPEPGSLALFGLGAAGLAGLRRRRAAYQATHP